jgi:hypothetical protein
LDDDTAAFAQRYPILENVRRFLLGETPKDKIPPAPQNCAPGSLQNKIIADIKNKQAQRKFASWAG